MSWCERLTADELLAEGAALEDRANELRVELGELEDELDDEGNRMIRSIRKLGANTVGAAAGIALGPLTSGLSAIAAAAPAIATAFELHDLIDEYRKHLRPLMKRIDDLYKESAEIDARLLDVLAEIEHRV